MFEQATYAFYTDTLGRSAVPSEADFDKYAFQNKLFVRSLLHDGLIAEREENGIDSAVCLMAEIDYNLACALSGESAPKTSESIGGYSYSVATKAHEVSVEKNAKSADAQKFAVLKLFCDVSSGRK